MDIITRYTSRPTAKPYRTRDLEAKEPYLDDNGHVGFHEGDIENPKNWSKARRWYITTVSVLLVVNATFASSSPSGAIQGIAEELHVSIEAANLVTTMFLLGYVAGPTLWGSISEFYGRRWIFYITFAGYIIFNFLCAWAPNFGGLIVGRLITGTFASAALSNAPGVIADLWDVHDRGNAIALFNVMTFSGPALGPVISGFLQLKENWRWSFYVLLWMGGGTFILLLTVPETLPSLVLIHKAERIRKQKIPGYENVQAPAEASDRTLVGIFKIALTRPFKILFDPISFLCAIYMSVVYTLIYMLFELYPIIFQEKHGFNAGVGELPFIGIVIGACLGSLFVVYNTRQNIKKEKAGHKFVPEDRLSIAMAGGILFPISMFWLAWTGEYPSIHWIAPALAAVSLAVSVLFIFVAYINYLTDTYLMYAASALAANTIVRSACAAASPLFTKYMFDALGVGGGGSLIGGVGVLLAIIPFAFYKYGGAIRERSKFAPTPPPKPKDEERADSSADETSTTDGEKAANPSQPQQENATEPHEEAEDSEAHEHAKQ